MAPAPAPAPAAAPAAPAVDVRFGAWTSEQAMRLCGITRTRLHHWIARGWLEAPSGRPGSGAALLFGFAALAKGRMLAAYAALGGRGYAAIAEALRLLSDDPEDAAWRPSAAACLVVPADGPPRLRPRPSSGGQQAALVFGIAGIAADIEAAMSDDPSLRPLEGADPQQRTPNSGLAALRRTRPPAGPRPGPARSAAGAATRPPA